METNRLFLDIMQENIEEIHQRYLLDSMGNDEVDVLLYWSEIKSSIKSVSNAVRKQMKED